MDLFGNDPMPAATLTPSAQPLAKHARVELTSGSYAWLTGSIASTWVRPDGVPMCDVALDAGYVVSVRVNAVGRL